MTLGAQVNVKTIVTRFTHDVATLMVTAPGSNRRMAHATVREECAMPQFAEAEPRRESKSGTSKVRPPVPPVVQRKAGDPSARPATAGWRASGLPPWLRMGVEARSGLAMDDVRVHRDSSEPAKLGALAFTKGSDIHLGPGQERHLPHEAWHVVQQKQGRVKATAQMKGMGVNVNAGLEAEADHAAAKLHHPAASGPRRSLLRRRSEGQVVQRKAPKPTVEESELALGQILRRPEHAAGLTLVFYDALNKVAVERAREFAEREQAIAYVGKPTARNVHFGKTLDIDLGIETASVALAKLAESALARVPPDPGVSAAAAMAPAKIAQLTIFSHGDVGWTPGLWKGQVPKVVKGMAPKLSNDVKVIFYACTVARDQDEKEDWVEGTMEGGGKKSLTGAVRDALIDEKLTGASVWGHAASGNPTWNVTKRVFEAQAGKGAAGESYVTKYIFTDSARDFVTKQIAETIRELGHTIDETDPKFVAAAAAVLKKSFYYAFLKAGKELPGVNVAEMAPLYPRLVAAKVLAFWIFTYWPRNRTEAATATLVKLGMIKEKKRKKKR